MSSHSTAPPAVSSCTERHPVVSVCSHGEKGHSEPAGAGGAGDIEPGVVSGERVRRGGRGGGGRRLHGHLSLRLKTRSGSRRCSRLRSCSLTPKLKTMQYCHQMMTALVSQHVCNVPCMHITHPLTELFCNPPHTGSKPVPSICIFFMLCARCTSELQRKPRLRTRSFTLACKFHLRRYVMYFNKQEGEMRTIGCIRGSRPHNL